MEELCSFVFFAPLEKLQDYVMEKKFEYLKDLFVSFRLYFVIARDTFIYLLYIIKFYKNVVSCPKKATISISPWIEQHIDPWWWARA
jgi:hypothetical protein